MGSSDNGILLDLSGNASELSRCSESKYSTLCGLPWPFSHWHLPRFFPLHMQRLFRGVTSLLKEFRRVRHSEAAGCSTFSMSLNTGDGVVLEKQTKKELWGKIKNTEVIKNVLEYTTSHRFKLIWNL